MSDKYHLLMKIKILTIPLLILLLLEHGEPVLAAQGSNSGNNIAIFLPLVQNNGGAPLKSPKIHNLVILDTHNSLWDKVTQTRGPARMDALSFRGTFLFQGTESPSAKTSFWTYIAEIFDVKLKTDGQFQVERLTGQMDQKLSNLADAGLPLNITPRDNFLHKVNCANCPAGLTITAYHLNPRSPEPRCELCHAPTASLHYVEDGFSGINCATCHADALVSIGSQ